MNDALLYLARTSIVNRVRGQIRRLRTPRYAIALLLGAGYFYLFLVRRVSPNGRAGGAVWAGTQVVASCGVLMLLLGAWLFQGERMALAFSAAELQFLFPAPITRRGLIAYKLFRAQLVILFNALLWVFVLRRSGSSLGAPLRFVGTWLLFTNLSLHRLGAALVRTSLLEHRGSGWRRHLASVVVGSAAVVALAFVARDAVHLMSGVRTGFLDAASALVDSPAARALLFVPRLIIAPSFAANGEAWVVALWPALVLLVLQVAWVLASDVAFEEAAVQASAARARRIEQRRARASGSGAAMRRPAKVRRSLPLAATGWPGTAIVWKNTLLLTRTQRTGPVVGLAAIAIVATVPLMRGRGATTEIVGVMALALLALFLVQGSRMLQNDFRQDAAYLATLKTLPLTGAQLVAAEVLSSALPLTAIQVALVCVAAASFHGAPSLGMSSSAQVAALALSPVVLFAFNVATTTLQNAATVLLPAWTGIQPAIGGGGVEVMGQSILALGMLLISTAIALLPAAIVFGVAALIIGPNAWHWWALCTVAAAAALLGEAWLAMLVLGRRVEKLEL